MSVMRNIVACATCCGLLVAAVCVATNAPRDTASDPLQQPDLPPAESHVPAHFTVWELGTTEIGGVHCLEAMFGEQRISIDVGVNLGFLAVALILQEANWRASALSHYFLDSRARSSSNSLSHIVIVGNQENMWRVVADACGTRRSAADRLADCTSVYDPLCDKAVIMWCDDNAWIWGVAHEVGHSLLHKVDHSLPRYIQEGFCELVAMSVFVRDYPSRTAYLDLKRHLTELQRSGALQATNGSSADLGRLADVWIEGRHSYSPSIVLAFDRLVEVRARQGDFEKTRLGSGYNDSVAARMLLTVSTDIWISIVDRATRCAMYD